MSFTTTSNGGLFNVLRTKCHVSLPFEPGESVPVDKQLPNAHEFDAIWDTGATNSCITDAVVKACGLEPTGMAQVTGVGGLTTAETYMVNFILPNGLGVRDVKVTKGMFTGGDVLIGMDVIALGDFAVTNFGGLTKFTFRFPSAAHIDFVEETNRMKAALETNNRAARRQAARDNNRRR